MSERNIAWPDGILYSVSQIKRFLSCPRSWYFERVLGFKQEEKDYQAWGKDAHRILEDVVLERTRIADLEDPRLVNAAENLRPYIGRVSDSGIERPVFLPLGPSELDPQRRMRWLVGFVDLVDYHPGRYMGVDYDFEVLDHKTLRSLHWAKMADDLENDLQLLTYAYPIGLELGTTPRAVKVSHHQVQREERIMSRLVSAVVPWSVITARWAQTLATIDLMDRVRLAKDAGLVQKNIYACSQYGGCPQGAVCALATLDGTKFARKLLPGEDAQKEVAIMSTPTINRGNTGGGLAALKALSAASAGGTIPTSPGPSGAATQTPPTAPSVPATTPVTAPVVQATPAQAEATTPPARVPAAPRASRAKPKPPETPPAPVVQATPAPAPEAPPSAPQAAVQAETPPALSREGAGLPVLYVGAMPSDMRDVVLVGSALADLERRYEESKGSPWTFAPYREGIGAMREGLRAFDFGGRSVVIPSLGTALELEAADVLASRAALVVRGLR